MDQSKVEAALNAKFEAMDIGNVSAREYLKCLLKTLLAKGESFSGKRPWGNSGWEHELATPMIQSGMIVGDVDEDGYGTPESESEYQAALIAMVDAL